MKIFLTIELIALLILLIGWGNDVRNRKDYHSPDGGWTVYYVYSEKARKLANNLTYLSAIIGIVGVLFLIWSN